MTYKKLFEPVLISPNNSIELDQLKELAKEWDILWRRISKSDVHIDFYMFCTPRIQFTSILYNDAIFIQGSHPKGTLVLSVIESNDICSFQNTSLEPYELVIIKSGEEMDFLAKTKNLIFTFAVEEEFFNTSFLHYFGYTIEDIQKNTKILLEKEVVSSLKKMMHSWQQHIQLSLFDEKAYKRVENEMLKKFFSFFQIKKRKISKEHFNISKAREILHANIENIYTIEDLVEDLHVSPRTLQHHFQKKLGISPKQYLQYLKLNAIREELLKLDPQEISITEVIMRYGYFNLSHFGSIYKTLFGQTPSETLLNQ